MTLIKNIVAVIKASPYIFRLFKDYLYGPRHLMQKIIIFYTIGILCSSEFLIGVKYQFLAFIPQILLGTIIGKVIPNDPSKEEHSNQIYEDLPFAICVVVPIIEEIIYRGILLTGFTYILSDIVAILLSSFIFGIVHLTNNKNDSHKQSICAGIGGILHGTLMINYGLWASIGSHVINNTMIVFFLLNVYPILIRRLVTYKE